MSDAQQQPRDPILDSARPQAAAEILLKLSWLRSAFIVGHGLASTFNTEEKWVEAMNDPDLQEEIVAYHEVIDDIKRESEAGKVPDFDAIEKVGAQHYTRALEAVALTADRLGVPMADLLVIFTR